VTYSITQLYGNTAVLSESPAAGCLAPNDEILLINLRSDSSVNYSVGKYEFLRIQSITGSTVYFTAPKTYWYGEGSYDDANIGIGSGQQRVVIQRVPNYNNLTVNSTLTGNAFNGYRYGVIAFRVAGILSGSGTLNATTLGFRGGTGCPPDEEYSGGNGESYFVGPGTSGAGLGSPESSSDYHPGSGGGGYARTGS
jgi:hypothetical protein